MMEHDCYQFMIDLKEISKHSFTFSKVTMCIMACPSDSINTSNFEATYFEPRTELREDFLQ